MKVCMQMTFSRATHNQSRWVTSLRLGPQTTCYIEQNTTRTSLTREVTACSSPISSRIMDIKNSPARKIGGFQQKVSFGIHLGRNWTKNRLRVNKAPVFKTS